MHSEVSTDLNWRTWLNQGDQYLKASKPNSNINRFGTEIVYNLLSMSLESYIMAILDIHDAMPENHTYTDLFYALDEVIDMDEQLKNNILKYENIQSICSVDKFIINKPSEEEITDLKGNMLRFSELAHEICRQSSVYIPIPS